MIDIDNLQQILEFRMGSDFKTLKSTCGTCAEDNASDISFGEALELITRLREAERDAARYRWLCEQAWFQVESEWQLILGETETEDDFIICANEKIDQAMKEKGDE